jgi:hypothetical protein
LHGADSLDYKYFPKLLGKCLDALKDQKDIDLTVSPTDAKQVNDGLKASI